MMHRMRRGSRVPFTSQPMGKRRLTSRLLAAGVPILLASACATADRAQKAVGAERLPAAAARSPFLPPPPDFAGTHWVLEEAEGLRLGASPGHRPVTLVFDGRRLVAGSGCHGHAAPYSVEEFRILTRQLIATEARCTMAVEPLERRVFAILGSPFDFRLADDGDLVVLRAGRAVLRFQRVPPPPLPTP